MNVPFKTEKRTLKGKKVAVLNLFCVNENKLLIKEFHNQSINFAKREQLDFVPFDKDLLAAIFPTYLS